MKKIILALTLLTISFSSFAGLALLKKPSHRGPASEKPENVEIRTLTVPGVSAEEVIARKKSLMIGLKNTSDEGVVQVAIYLGYSENDAKRSAKALIADDIRRINANDFLAMARIEAAYGRYYLNNFLDNK